MQIKIIEKDKILLINNMNKIKLMFKNRKLMKQLVTKAIIKIVNHKIS